jgi:membrane protease YdiL (CAAX protease family)
MKRFKLLIATFAVAVFGVFALVPVANVGALDPLAGACASDPGTEVCAKKTENAQDLIKTIIRVLLFIVGALAVIMIIFSGIQYVISSGDAGKVAKAKSTLLYSVIGLVVAFIAFAIVNWVIDQFQP